MLMMALPICSSLPPISHTMDAAEAVAAETPQPQVADSLPVKIDLAEDATPADLAAGVVNLVLQAIGTMTVLACQCCDSKTVVLTGSMTTLPQAVTNFQLFEKLYGIHYIIPENATFATAIGAGLYSLQKKPEA